jgi:hypothetical protein
MSQLENASHVKCGAGKPKKLNGTTLLDNIMKISSELLKSERAACK